MARGSYSRPSSVSIKVSEQVFATAAIAASATGQTIGQWVEGAIRYTAEADQRERQRAEWRRQNGTSIPGGPRNR